MKKIISILAITIFTSNSLSGQCTCGTTIRWSPSLIKIGRLVADKYKCGHQFTTTCYDTIKFRAGGYNCTGAPCTRKYKANLYTSTGALIRTLDPFNFSSSLLVFNRPDTYKLEILAFCNNNSCKPCFYYFTVRNIGCR